MNKIILTVLLSAVFCLAQEKANPAKPTLKDLPSAVPTFTLEDVQVMATYYSKANIPARSDSATLAALQTLRIKLNAAMATKNTSGLALTNDEKSLMTFMLGDDVPAARRVLMLNSKLVLAPAVTKKDTSKTLAKK